MDWHGASRLLMGCLWQSHRVFGVAWGITIDGG
jgi:hypothetical protein